MRGIIFYPMMFLRPFLKIILRICSFFCLIGAFAFFTSGKSFEGGVVVVLLFVTFLLGQFYDNILLKLNPTDNLLILSD